ncbi:hypothetical protein Ndes2526A_g00377 [Nannochloris sp. 'desiccata']|nr:hypothetical protein KSW81_003162 [Chlorella desiccata (nom. nud.)]
MSRDLALYFSNKLASEWSASSVAGLLSPAVVEDISTTQKWEALDPLVRVRLLLAPMFLRRQELAGLRPALTTLAKSVVAQDSDEWVRVIAAAVGSYDGVLHLDNVLEHSKLVKATLEELKRHGTGADPTIFRPLEEEYLSAAVLEKRLPGSSVKRKHIPEHSHFILRDAAKAPGNSEPSSIAGAMAATVPAAATATGASTRPPSSGIFKPSKPSGSGNLAGKPPMGPSRLAAPGGGGPPGAGKRGGGSVDVGSGSLFMANRKPLGGGIAARASGSAALGGSKSTAFKQKKKAAIIDINAVAELNQAAAIEKERKQKQDEKEREAAASARSEAKRVEKEAKEEKKKRDIARAAAAKEAEKEFEKAKKEAEALAAMEAKEAVKAAKESERLRKETEKEAAKEDAARKRMLEHAEREAQRAQREAEKLQRERAKAARAELKRAAAAEGGEYGSERPLKASKRNAGATASTHTLPSALTTAQQLMDSAVIQPGTNGEAPLVQLLDPQVALAALREAEAMSQGVYGDYTVLQRQQGHQVGCWAAGDDEEDEDDAMQRYIEMGRAAAAAAEMQRKDERQQGDK